MILDNTRYGTRHQPRVRWAERHLILSMVIPTTECGTMVWITVNVVWARQRRRPASGSRQSSRLIVPSLGRCHVMNTPKIIEFMQLKLTIRQWYGKMLLLPPVATVHRRTSVVDAMRFITVKNKSFCKYIKIGLIRQFYLCARKLKLYDWRFIGTYWNSFANKTKWSEQCLNFAETLFCRFRIINLGSQKNFREHECSSIYAHVFVLPRTFKSLTSPCPFFKRDLVIIIWTICTAMERSR